MVAITITLLVFAMALAAEKIHQRRCRLTGRLAFGPEGVPRLWTHLAPFLRIVCIAALAWSLIVLLKIEPKVFTNKGLPEAEYRHMIIVLDVSPSMRIADSGLDGKQTRAKRASDVLTSIFDRIQVDQVMFSVIAVYTGAKPVVMDTTDMAVINNILDDLPLDYAFEFGKTKLIDGINLAAAKAAEYDEDSTTIIMLTDGDTVPDSGMSSMPPAVAKLLLIGLGSRQGRFLDGHQSRQDSSVLRSIARRLGGEYYDANIRHLPTQAIKSLAEAIPLTMKKYFGQRELAMALAVIASGILALLPLALNLLGSKWHNRLKAGN